MDTLDDRIYEWHEAAIMHQSDSIPTLDNMI